MSAFLGPIHYWLYHKIKLQQEIIDEIYEIGNKYGLSLKEECEKTYGSLEDKPLEEIIDTYNIHGWLQERVSQVEYKLAYSATRIIQKDPAEGLQLLKSIFFNKGCELGKSLQDESLAAPGLFKIISDHLLDGMPCDHANSLIDQSETEATWKRNICVHSNYWDETGGNINNYYELRAAWIEGLALECKFEFEQLDSVTYRLKKGE